MTSQVGTLGKKDFHIRPTVLPISANPCLVCTLESNQSINKCLFSWFTSSLQGSTDLRLRVSTADSAHQLWNFIDVLEILNCHESQSYNRINRISHNWCCWSISRTNFSGVVISAQMTRSSLSKGGWNSLLLQFMSCPVTATQWIQKIVFAWNCSGRELSGCDYQKRHCPTTLRHSDCIHQWFKHWSRDPEIRATPPASAIPSSTHGGLCWLSPKVLQQTAPWTCPPQLEQPLHKRLRHNFNP